MISNVHDVYRASYTFDENNNDQSNSIKPWFGNQSGNWKDFVPVNRIAIKPLSSSRKLNSNIQYVAYYSTVRF